MSIRLTLRAAALAAAIALTALPAGAQPRGGGPGMPQYDPATEVTLQGTVGDVQTHQGRMNRTGTHLQLDTSTGAMDVHVGPTNWLESHAYTFAKGDALTVVGSRVTIDGKEALLARTITKGETTMVLRDDRGRPKWAGGRGRSSR